MVFITPHIVRTPEEADEITQEQQSELSLPKIAREVNTSRAITNPPDKPTLTTE